MKIYEFIQAFLGFDLNVNCWRVEDNNFAFPFVFFPRFCVDSNSIYDFDWRRWMGKWIWVENSIEFSFGFLKLFYVSERGLELPFMHALPF